LYLVLLFVLLLLLLLLLLTRPEFRAQFEQLQSIVFTQSKIKRVDGAEMHGAALLHLAGAYVAAMNGGAMPTIRTAWQSVLEIESRNAIDQAQHTFAQALHDFVNNESLVLDTAELQALETRAREQAVVTLRQLSVGDEQLKQQLEHDLNTKLSSALAQHHQINQLRSRNVCTTVMQRHYVSLGGDAQLFRLQSAADFGVFREQLLALYTADARGPDRELVAREFLDKISLLHAQRMFERQAQLQAASDRMLSELEHLRPLAAQGEVYRKQVEQLTDEAGGLRDSASELHAKLKMQEHSTGQLQAQVQQLTEDKSKLKQQLQQAKKTQTV
jgi:hypothetical protein